MHRHDVMDKVNRKMLPRAEEISINLTRDESIVFMRFVREKMLNYKKHKWLRENENDPTACERVNEEVKLDRFIKPQSCYINSAQELIEEIRLGNATSLVRQGVRVKIDFEFLGKGLANVHEIVDSLAAKIKDKLVE